MAREGDVLLVYYQDKPSVYARIELIEPDIKKDWYQLTLLILTIPARTVTWILREEYINGAPFTMGGTPMRLEEVKKLPMEREREKEGEKMVPGKPATVIPFKKT
ncbi:MAG: hypothetical protein JRD02_02280 [Deltaproteobacteria bacterium]|nr:hypothetical protein [Deltaproteobacteria bacterium]